MLNIAKYVFFVYFWILNFNIDLFFESNQLVVSQLIFLALKTQKTILCWVCLNFF